MPLYSFSDDGTFSLSLSLSLLPRSRVFVAGSISPTDVERNTFAVTDGVLNALNAGIRDRAPLGTIITGVDTHDASSSLPFPFPGFRSYYSPRLKH